MTRKDTPVIINLILIFYVGISFILLVFYPISALYPLLIIFVLSSPFIIFTSILLLYIYVRRRGKYEKMAFTYRIAIWFILFILSLIPLILLIWLLSHGFT